MPLPMTRIILYVQDVTLLKAFYQRHFDLPVIEEIDGEWAVLDAGAIELALHLAGPAFRDAAAPSNANPATNNVKLVFRIDADIDAHRDRLARDGVTVRDVKRFDGFPYRLLDGIDPEGNVFQVMQPD
ncbi:VOC family protein [Burkholderia cepacia]|uniref:Lactoylglutathione lyase n=1 Tax=Burkholderia cepacia TaxID=292 RepID=A0ABN5D537_BURCE|nr:VOC family protein [Burkholderia cepacia]AIO29789.1 glyoxalase-like domain protein [Burkholderia cepacia ATCC 25416]ALK20808.1 lactoylglutathione lyase [Burkholderia cepacia ATCC 25416]ASE99126.1 lactoylglutathione lyase [Burkholderia cepacia]ATF82606.1 lactoylglutathione lyase [Burkholderia cepacia]MCA8469048.1 VOC family protein [Burkholderia cepacia]